MNAPLSKLRAPLLGGLAMTALAATSGCATFGGNVRGDFSCRAPGGTCAPMSAIDARAVGAIIGSSGSETSDAASKAAPRLIVQAASGGVARTAERTLRIVFPAHVDAAGVLHDEASAHVVVEDASWTLGPAIAAVPPEGGDNAANEFSRSHAPSSLREAIAGASAPATEGLGSLPAQAPHPITGIDAPIATPLPAAPSPEALAAARAGHRIAGPLNDRPTAMASRSDREDAPRPGRRAALPGIAAPAAAAERVRVLAAPALRAGSATPGQPDLDTLFRPVAPNAESPK